MANMFLLTLHIIAAKDLPGKQGCSRYEYCDGTYLLKKEKSVITWAGSVQFCTQRVVFTHHKNNRKQPSMSNSRAMRGDQGGRTPRNSIHRIDMSKKRQIGSTSTAMQMRTAKSVNLFTVAIGKKDDDRTVRKKPTSGCV